MSAGSATTPVQSTATNQMTLTMGSGGGSMGGQQSGNQAQGQGQGTSAGSAGTSYDSYGVRAPASSGNGQASGGQQTGGQGSQPN